MEVKVRWLSSQEWAIMSHAIHILMTVKGINGFNEKVIVNLEFQWSVGVRNKTFLSRKKRHWILNSTLLISCLTLARILKTWSLIIPAWNNIRIIYPYGSLHIKKIIRINLRLSAKKNKLKRLYYRVYYTPKTRHV